MFDLEFVLRTGCRRASGPLAEDPRQQYTGNTWACRTTYYHSSREGLLFVFVVFRESVLQYVQYLSSLRLSDC